LWLPSSYPPCLNLAHPIQDSAYWCQACFLSTFFHVDMNTCIYMYFFLHVPSHRHRDTYIFGLIWANLSCFLGVFYGGTGVWTQDLALAGQLLYHLSPISHILPM
jgi:hypothetical protein